MKNLILTVLISSSVFAIEFDPADLKSPVTKEQWHSSTEQLLSHYIGSFMKSDDSLNEDEALAIVRQGFINGATQAEVMTIAINTLATNYPQAQGDEALNLIEKSLRKNYEKFEDALRSFNDAKEDLNKVEDQQADGFGNAMRAYNQAMNELNQLGIGMGMQGGSQLNQMQRHLGKETDDSTRTPSESSNDSIQ